MKEIVNEDKKEGEEVKDTPQKQVREKKKVGSRKRSSRRKKKRKTKTSE